MKVERLVRERSKNQKAKATTDINRGGPCHKVGERKQRLTPP